MAGGALLVVAGPEAALDGAAHALERRGGDDALGRAADAEQDVGAGVGPGGGDAAGDVAVGDEADAGAGLADLADQLVVAGAVEHHGGELGDPLAEGLGHGVEVLGGGGGDVDDVGGLGADRDLLHVHDRPGVEHRAPLADGDDGDGVAPARGR